MKEAVGEPIHDFVSQKADIDIDRTYLRRFQHPVEQNTQVPLVPMCTSQYADGLRQSV
jgi:hypothetical protein